MTEGSVDLSPCLSESGRQHTYTHDSHCLKKCSSHQSQRCFLIADKQLTHTCTLAHIDPRVTVMFAASTPFQNASLQINMQKPSNAAMSGHTHTHHTHTRTLSRSCRFCINYQLKCSLEPEQMQKCFLTVEHAEQRDSYQELAYQ